MAQTNKSTEESKDVISSVQRLKDEGGFNELFKGLKDARRHLEFVSKRIKDLRTEYDRIYADEVTDNGASEYDDIVLADDGYVVETADKAPVQAPQPVETKVTVEPVAEASAESRSIETVKSDKVSDSVDMLQEKQSKVTVPVAETVLKREEEVTVTPKASGKIDPIQDQVVSQPAKTNVVEVKKPVAPVAPVAPPAAAAVNKTAQSAKPVTSASAPVAKSEPVSADAPPAVKLPDYIVRQATTRVRKIEYGPSGPRRDGAAPNAQGGTRPPYDRNRPPYQQGAQGSRPPYNNNAGGGTGRPFTPRDGAHQGPPRPGQGAGSRGGLGVAPAILPSAPGREKTRVHDPKKDTKPDDKKTINKRTLVRRGYVGMDEMEGGRNVHRKLKGKKGKLLERDIKKIDYAAITTENLTVKILSEKIGITAQEIIKQLMELGIMTTINSVVDFATMELVADALGVKLELKLEKTKEEVLEEFHDDEADETENLMERPPIVTVMGHVDHGKTSLLDSIRKTNVIGGEAGGITQHIGAYTVTLDGRKITFIDTPGHEAFTEMRARGAKITDVAIIVVAADDGIMPQTIEAINHAKAANVPIVVAVNKIDKPAANMQRILQQLTEHDVLCEEWGGDSPVVGISAKLGQNIDQLLKSVLDIAEISELKANPDRKARGTVIESRLDKGKGPVATIIVQNGTLRVGDVVVSGTSYGHIRAMHDDKGRIVKEAGPSMAVSVQGFQDVPNAGGIVHAVEDEKLAKQVASERADKMKAEVAGSTSAMISLDAMFDKISEGQLKDLNIIIKADVQGSIEALKSSLEKLTNEEVRIKTIHCGVGAISKTDVMLAGASNAIIIGFNVRPDAETKVLAEKSGIDIRIYRIIYDAIEELGAAVKGMLTPKFREQVIGHAEVRNIFNITGSGVVAGCYITDGKLVRNANARILRKNVVVFDGMFGSLKRLKDDVKEVASGYECGVTIQNFEKFEEGDIIEAFVLEQL